MQQNTLIFNLPVDYSPVSVGESLPEPALAEGGTKLL